MAKEHSFFDYTRNWFNFCFDNPESVTPLHTAMYCWLVELNNRMGWAEKFSSPTSQSMQAIGIKSYNTHKKIFNDLVRFGFVKVIQESRNQFQCTIIALSRDVKALDKALDKALINQVTEHSTKHDTTHSTKHSKYNNTIDNRQYTIDNTQNDSAQLSFTQFWEAYAKKVDSKKCQDKWMKLTEKEQQKALQVVGDYVKSTPDVQFRKNPLTWINGKCWNDQIQQPQLPLQTERPKYIMQPRDFATDAEYEDYCRKNGLTPKY